MKIAWCTPFSPRSAIGTYSEIIVDRLADLDGVTIFAPAGAGECAPRPSRHSVLGIPREITPEFSEFFRDFDIHIFNMGNHTGNHGDIYELSQRFPGVVILHDLVMRDFFRGFCLERQQSRQEFHFHSRYCHGQAGERLWGDELAGRFVETIDHPIRLELPMFKSALQRSLGVIVHSDYAKQRVSQAIPVPVEHLDFPNVSPVAATRVDPLKDSAGPIRLLTYGVIIPNKMIHATILALASLKDLPRKTQFTVIGEGDPGYIAHLQRLIRENGLEGTVDMPGWLSDSELDEAIAKADLVINLRNPHCGESSWSLLGSLSAGVPTIVWNHGYYAEFPDHVVGKVDSEVDLTNELRKFCGDEWLRKKIGADAKAHARDRFNTDLYCERFRRFVAVARGRKPALALADQVSDRLIELGASPQDGLDRRMAGVLAGFLGTAAGSGTI